MKRTKAMLKQQIPTAFRNGAWEHETVEFEVRIMATAEGYAMVRRKGAMPFVCQEKELSDRSTIGGERC